MVFDIERVREIAVQVGASSGVEVVEVDMRGSGGARMLRVFIDKPGGVTHEDCANVSRELSAIFDVEDAVPGGSYVLEVSSPGLDRKLSKPADFERFTGSRVKLTTRTPVNGDRHFEGRLQSFNEGRLTLELGTPAKQKSKKPKSGAVVETVEIDLSNIEKANLVPEV